MKIKLCKQNYDKINALLLAVNGKAEEHTLTETGEIVFANSTRTGRAAFLYGIMP